MSRSAAFLGSKTGHGGDVVQGSSDVLVNGKGAVRVGHAVVCPKHGKSAVATGRKDVFVNGELMSRLDDKVVCVGPPSGGSGALVDHGKPAAKVGDYDIYLDGALLDLPEKERAELQKALESGDPVAIHDAIRKLPIKANAGKGVLKVVDPATPNEWTEIEVTGPGVSLASPTGGPTAEPKEGGARAQGGGSFAVFGTKGTRVKRYVADDGSVREVRESATAGASEGASIDIEWSKDRKGIVFDTPFGWGGGAEDIAVAAAPPAGGPLPATDVIVPPVSPDVLLGD